MQKGNEIKLVMYEKAGINPAGIPELITQLSPALRFAAEPKNPYFIYQMQANSRDKNQNVLETLEIILKAMEEKLLGGGLSEA